MKKLLQFGAGNIGRSFIGQVFSRGGYEVVFVDINDVVVTALNERHRYRVMVKKNEEPDEEIIVSNVRAVHGSDRNRVAEEIAEADVVSTSVGIGALSHIFPVLALGIELRFSRSPGKPLDIIIAENIRNGSEFFSSELQKHIADTVPFNSYVGLVETSIGKMVPIMKDEDIARDPVWVFAEAYNTLILDGKGFRNQVPAIPGIKAVGNITAYVDRKLFIHNLGHAAAAYFGFQALPDSDYIWEVLQKENVYSDVRTAMEESAEALSAEYPEDLRRGDLQNHIEDLLYRFQNRSLGDTVFRVGRDLFRKLDKSDRLVGAMKLAKKHALPCSAIAAAVTAGFRFRARDEHGELHPGDRDFAERVYQKGLEVILREVCHLSESDPLEHLVMDEIRTFS